MFAQNRDRGYTLDLPNQGCKLKRSTMQGHVSMMTRNWGPHGFWGSGENGYLFSGSWGALVIILGELGSKLVIFGT